MAHSDRVGRVGVGVDLVHIPSFAAQLREPGSTFSQVFTGREWAVATSCEATAPYERHLPHCGPAGENTESNAVSVNFSPRVHEWLGARWAAKEAAIKAWSSLLIGQPPPLKADEVHWADIEVVQDRWKRPHYRFHGDIYRQLELLTASIGQLNWALSLSHDGEYAIAYAHVVVGALSAERTDHVDSSH